MYSAVEWYAFAYSQTAVQVGHVCRGGRPQTVVAVDWKFTEHPKWHGLGLRFYPWDQGRGIRYKNSDDASITVVLFYFK